LAPSDVDKVAEVLLSSLGACRKMQPSSRLCRVAGLHAPLQASGDNNSH
jgi:hypothetical protein